MSTCADAKTLPATAEYRAEHERIFGTRADAPPEAERKVYVMRCSTCDGAQHAPDAKLYLCGRCQGWTMGSVDAAQAPIFRENEARTAPVMVDRFMEGDRAQDGTDIGSRKKRREYMKATGVADASDYGPGWGERVRNGRERELSKRTRETVERVVYTRWKP